MQRISKLFLVVFIIICFVGCSSINQVKGIDTNTVLYVLGTTTTIVYLIGKFVFNYDIFNPPPKTITVSTPTNSSLYNRTTSETSVDGSTTNIPLQDEVYKAESTPENTNELLKEEKKPEKDQLIQAGQERVKQWDIKIPEVFWESELLLRAGVDDLRGLKVKDVFRDIIFIELKNMDGTIRNIGYYPVKYRGNTVILEVKLSEDAIFQMEFIYSDGDVLFESLKETVSGEVSEDWREVLFFMNNLWLPLLGVR